LKEWKKMSAFGVELDVAICSERAFPFETKDQKWGRKREAGRDNLNTLDLTVNKIQGDKLGLLTCQNLGESLFFFSIK
jgi:hypothetical protein